MTEASKDTKSFLIENVKEIIVGGITIKVDGGDVKVIGGKLAPANDTAIKAAKDALEIGQRMYDGSVYGGLTPDGKYQIFAKEEDLDFTKSFHGVPQYVTMTFNDAVKRIKDLNTDVPFGARKDWQIGSLEVMQVLQKNMDKGYLKDTFNTFDNPGFKANGQTDYDNWPTVYWTSTERNNGMPNMYDIDFRGGRVSWHLKDRIKQACRPVRLVPVPGL